MPDPNPTLPRIGRYTLLAQIAHGGMAEVYLATQDGPQGFQKIVVIKRILPHLAKEKEFVRMFLDEARLAALINHPNVVSIFELGEDPETGGYFMAMEYIDGRNLRDVAEIARQRRRPLPPRLCARIIADASAGLHYAHELHRPIEGEPLRIVHRDVSPENLLITYGGLVKVVDFGIAKATQSEHLTKTGEIKGKLSYLSPETLQGRKVDRRADLWSLGVTLYWLLVGERPFRGDSEPDVMRAVLEGTPAPLPPRARNSLAPFQPILDRALAKDPAQRYATALELQEALERLLAGKARPTTAATVGATMEKLFPKATDPERIRHRKILRNEPVEEISAFLLGSGPAPRKRSRVRWWIALAGLAAVAAAVGVEWEPLQRLAREHGFPSQLSWGPAAAAPAVTAAPEPAATPEPTEAPPAEPVQGSAPDAAPETPPSTQAVAPVIAPVAAPGPGTDAGALDAGGEAASAPAAAPATPAPRRRKAPPGFLDVQARGGLTVVVDGTRIGMTPLPRVRLPPGHHRVELIDVRNPGRNDHRVVQVEVRSREITLIH